MFLPLSGSNQESGAHWLASGTGGGECGVIGNSQVIPEPDQLCHRVILVS